MNQVKKEKLTGFRLPTEWEKAGIQRYLIPELKKTGQSIFVGGLFCGIADLSFILSMLTKFSNASMGVLILWAAFVMILTLGFRTLLKRSKVNRKLTENIQQGIFEVLDCKAYETDMSTDNVEGRGVKIYNDLGQYCEELFIADIESVRESRENKSLWFLLMKTTCDSGKEYRYELFTERKLERG